MVWIRICSCQLWSFFFFFLLFILAGGVGIAVCFSPPLGRLAFRLCLFIYLSLLLFDDNSAIQIGTRTRAVPSLGPDQKHQNSASAVSFFHHKKDFSIFPKHPYIQQGRWTNSSWLYVCGIWQLIYASGSMFDAIASVSLRFELYVWSLCTATMQTSCCNHSVSATQRWVLWKHLFFITMCVWVHVWVWRTGCIGRIKVACIPLHYIYRGGTKYWKPITMDLINTSRNSFNPAWNAVLNAVLKKWDFGLLFKKKIFYFFEGWRRWISDS